MNRPSRDPHPERSAPGMDDSMIVWMKQAGRRPLLKAAEERALLERAERGDASARDRLIESNLRLVMSVARRYARPELPLGDLVQEGTIGLIHAVDRFDLSRNLRLSTYAVWWIRHAVERFIQDRGGIVRFPAHIAARTRKTAAAEDRLRRAGKEPSLEEIAAEAGLSTATVAALPTLDRQTISLDQAISEDQETRLSELIADPNATTADDIIDKVCLAADVHAALLELDPREREILILRYGLDGAEPRTLKEVGGRIGLTSERVRQIERGAAAKLRAGDLAA